MCLPLMEVIKIRYPDVEHVVSLWSPSALSHPVIKNGNHPPFFFLPIDTKKNIERIINAVNPVALFVMKYELWFNLFREFYMRGIPVFLVSFRPNFEKMAKFSIYRSYVFECLNMCSVVFTCTEKTRKKLLDYGIMNVVASGDIRMDNMKKIRERNHNLSIEIRFACDLPVFIAGSVWKSDIDFLRDFFKRNENKFNFIIVPHKIDAEIIKYVNNVLWGKGTLMSSLGSDEVIKTPFLIVDRYGILKHLYGIASFSYVGGSRAHGLHNIFEPLAWNVPVAYLPPHPKFEEAEMFEEIGVSMRVSTTQQLEYAVRNLTRDIVKDRIDMFLMERGSVSDFIVSKVSEIVQVKA